MTITARRLATASFLLCLAQPAVTPSGLAQAQPDPRVIPLAPVHDVGKVPQGTTIEHAFVLRNQGEVPVAITEVRASCGCTVAQFDPTIAPGAEGAVRVEVETDDFRGPIAKSVTVLTDDPGNPRIELVVKAQVELYIEVEPGFARFVQVEGSSQQTVEQTIWSVDRPGIKVLQVKTPWPYLEGESVRQPGTEEGAPDRWTIRLTLSDEAPVGSLSGRVVVETDHPRQPRVEIPVIGLVRPVLAVVPPVADFGERLLEEPFAASLEVRNQTDQPIELTAVASDLPGVSAEIEALEPGRRYQVRVTLAPSMPQGEFAGRLRISTDSSRKPELEVEVKGTVVGPLS